MHTANIYCLAGIVKIILFCGKSNLSTKKYIIENLQTSVQTYFLLFFCDVSGYFCHHHCVNSHKYHITVNGDVQIQNAFASFTSYTFTWKVVAIGTKHTTSYITLIVDLN